MDVPSSQNASRSHREAGRHAVAVMVWPVLGVVVGKAGWGSRQVGI